MIKQATNTEICSSCGANIRPGALFCYHCGAQVASLPIEESSKAEENGKAKSPIAEASKPVIVSEKRETLKGTRELVSKESKQPLAGKENLKTDAPVAARRKVVRKEADVTKFVWVEKESTSNVWFIIAAIIIVAIAVVVLIAMLYIK